MPFSALAFKIMNDPFVGSLTFVRIYSGTLSKGDTMLNATKGKKERVGRMMMMHSNNREDIDKAYAGDIIALAGLKGTDDGRHAVRGTPAGRARDDDLPRAGYRDCRRAAGPRTTRNACRRACSGLRPRIPRSGSRPTGIGPDDHEGMGELHLDILVDRLKREFKVEANVGGAPGRLSRDRLPDGGNRLHPQEADRRRRPVRPNQAGDHSGRTGGRLLRSSRPSWAVRSPRNNPRRRERHRLRDGQRPRSPGSR